MRCTSHRRPIFRASPATGSGTDEATSPAYWARHAREPVRFADGVKTLTASAPSILLEVGPGVTLSTLALQTVRDLVGRTFGSLPDASAPTADEETMLSALGKLWVSGVAPDWASVGDGSRSRVSLPTYPFERRRHWIEAPVRGAASSAPAFSSPPAIVSVEAETAAVSLAGSGQAQEAEMDGIRESIAEILQDVSGETVDPAATVTFLELGFDSLLLSQVAQQIQRRLKVKIAFRQLLGDLSTIHALERFIRAEAPAAVKRPVATSAPAVATAVISPPAAAFVPPPIGLDGTNAGVAEIMRAQMEAMSSLIQGQLDALKRLGSSDSVIVAAGSGSPGDCVCF